MASKSTGPRQPLEQLKELEKDGRIRRFLCHVLILRVFAYIAAQPASFFFILSLMVITVSMPPVALHVRNTGSLPDLDAMRVSRRERVGRSGRDREWENVRGYVGVLTSLQNVATSWRV